MVNPVTNLGRSGVQDWLIQRFSALVLLAYFLFLATFFLIHPGLNFAEWQALFDAAWMRLFSTLALLSLVLHAWVGLWGVTTDYLNERALGQHAIVLRLSVQFGVALLLFAYLILGLGTVWGIG